MLLIIWQHDNKFSTCLFETIASERAPFLVTVALRFAKTVEVSFRELDGMDKLNFFHASRFYPKPFCNFFDFCQCHSFLLSSSFIIIF